MLVQENRRAFFFFFFFFFLRTVNVRTYIEKGVKNSEIWRKKSYVFQPLKL